MSVFAAYSSANKDEPEFGFDVFKKGWYAGTASLQGGHAMAVKVDKILHKEQSKYQTVTVFESAVWGRSLVLDVDIQSTEFDEFSYHEMMTFLPINSHPNPKKVLVIGGGDGGIVREATKHPLVESVTLCEVDEKVIEVSKKFLPGMAKGLESPKLKLLVEDGSKFIKNVQGEFDVIIADTPDPIGPAVCLYQKSYYEALKKALKPGGILGTYGASFWYDRELVKEVFKVMRSLFPVVEYASTYIATFPAGQVGHMCCSLNPQTNFREPVHQFSDEMLEKMELKYYTTDVHRGAFSLPLMVARDFGQKWRS